MDKTLTWADLPEAKPVLKLADELDAVYKEYEKNLPPNVSAWNKADKPTIYVGHDLIRHDYNKPFVTNDRFINERTKAVDEIMDVVNRARPLVAALLEAGEKYRVSIGELPKWNQDLSLEENNARLEEAGFASFDKKLFCQIEVKPGVFFEVRYGMMRKQQNPYFSTMVLSEGDGGQVQERLLNHGDLAYRFYKTWNKFHTQTLTLEEYAAMVNNLSQVISRYDGKNYEDY